MTMNLTTFIGDCHGLFSQYESLRQYHDRTIQLGDMGVGFPGYNEEPVDFSPDHRWIRGNHDNPAVCERRPDWIKDGTVEGNVMFIGGAWSIDQDYRTPDVSWWEDEELSYSRLIDMIAKAEAHKPEIMVTHDCPYEVAKEIFAATGAPNFGQKMIGSRTASALQAIFETVKPKLWIFGHWHWDTAKTIMGTTFICLSELSTIDIDLDSGEVVSPIIPGTGRLSR